MRVNLEESFPYRTFSATMLHRIRDKVLKDKYGDNLHNLHDLFMKGDRIRFYGGKFIVVPSANDFCIATIHCQTKLMGEYANIYGTDGFRMSDGTHKITKYDMTFIFWMVVDCLLRSKFVGYTANFTENSEVIIDGANVFFGQQVSRTHPSQGNDNNICVGGIPGYFDPFVDNEIDLAEESMKDLLNKDISSGHSGDSLNRTNLYSNTSDLSMNCGSGAGFMTDEGSAFPIVAEHFGWTHLLDRRHFATQDCCNEVFLCGDN
jgi:hypothetical protein